MTKPQWMKKHPCTKCGAGYGECIEHVAFNLMCCDECNHPGRWEPQPYTDEEYKEMGRDN